MIYQALRTKRQKRKQSPFLLSLFIPMVEIQGS